MVLPVSLSRAAKKTGIAISNVSVRSLVQFAFYVGLLLYAFHLGRTTSERSYDYVVDTNVANTINSINKINHNNNDDKISPVVFDFPPTVKDILINVGSNLDPIMLSAAEYGPCARTIAVEPIVGCNIKKHPQINVLHAAVSDAPGVLSMRRYNAHGVSSSLAKPSASMGWSEKGPRNGKLSLVPVVTLSSIILAVPKTATIRALMTDIQGYDFVAIKAAGPALLERVTHMVTEVWLDDVHTYEVENDLCRDFLPFMTELGYTLVDLYEQYTTKVDVSNIKERCAEQLKRRPRRPAVNETVGLSEADAFWVRNDVVDQPFPAYARLPEHRQNTNFSKSDYQTCET